MNTKTQALASILAYHERTKHRLARYAAGPEALDWDAQPNPFREFAGTPKTLLPLSADTLPTRFADLHRPGAVAPQPLTIDSVGILLELSLAISAWKEYGPDRWALRCNPSSGNLHPTEAYVVCRNIPGIKDGVHHYLSLDHSLELRCRYEPRGIGAPGAPTSLHIGLSSVTWREAWKYGERAFRYCQHDTGHALAALRYAAAALGWKARLHDEIGSSALAALLGLNRAADYLDAEREEAELLIGIGPGNTALSPAELNLESEWLGRANRLDPHPMYRWPVIDEVVAATQKPATAAARWIPQSIPPLPPLPPLPTPAGANDLVAATLFRQRRSAQHFDRTAELDAAGFYRMLDALLPRDTAPWDVWGFEPRLHPVLFVHRVSGVPPGIYALPRHAGAEARLRQAMRQDYVWRKPADCPAHLPLYCLMETRTAKLARTVSCHQAIAADSAFSLAMLAEFDEPLADAPWRYRQLFWEAGLIGQVLYLEAEATGIRGTGIGCYFDDTCHELFGLEGKTFQSLYHFTVGTPLIDERIATCPPYPAARQR